MALDRKYLSDLGLEESVIENIMAEHGKTISKEKGRVQTLEDRNDALVEQNNSYQSEIEKLKEENKGNEDFQNKLQSLQDKAIAIDGKYKNLLIESAIKDQSQDAKDFKVIKKLIDTETIKVDGDEVTGVKEEIEKLRQESPFLFNNDSDERGQQDEDNNGDSKRKDEEQEKGTNFEFNAGNSRGNKGKEIDPEEIGSQYAKKLFGEQANN